MKLKHDEHVVMRCPKDGRCQIIKGANTRQEALRSGWSLDNVKCPRCKGPMDIATASVLGLEDDGRGCVKIQPIYATSAVGRQYVHEHEATRLQWFWRSTDIWKAIDKEIQKAEIGGSVFTEKRHHIQNSSAHSGVHLKKVYAHAPGSDDKETVRFCYDVSFYDDDEDSRRPEYSSYGMVDVPVTLVEDFQEVDFRKFVESRRGMQAERNREWMASCVLELFDNHPDLKPDDIQDLLNEARDKG
jgi:hypothetical protein